MIDKLNDLLDEYRDARRNAFVTALMINSSGKYIAGIFGVNIPREILWALDIVPINIYSIDDSNIAAAEKLIDSENCSVIKASYGYYITDKCPLTHFSDIIIGTDLCHKKLSMIQKLGDKKKIYIIKELNDVDALALEYHKFVSALEHGFNLKISNSKLLCAIKRTNDINKKIHELINLCMLKPNIISLEDLYSIIYGSQFIFDLDERYDKLSEIIKILKNIDNKQSENSKKKRILISGAPLSGLKEKILSQLTLINGVSSICAESFCEGESYMLIDEAKDPYIALAEKYIASKDIKNQADLYENEIYDAIINVNLAGCGVSDCYEHSDKPNLSIITYYGDDDNEEISDELKSFINSL